MRNKTKRIVMFMANWFCLITMPVWLGTYILILAIKSKGIGREELKGKKWLFE